MSPWGTAVEEVLRRRAADLARPPAADDAPRTAVVVVEVAGRRYALETGFVRQVVHNRGARRLPASATALVGLAQVRGDAVPLVDLAALLGLDDADLGRELVVVLDGRHPPLGLLVDAVLAADTVPDDDLTTSPGAAGDASSLERAVLPDGVVLLDAETLLLDHRVSPGPRPPTPSPQHG